MAKETAEQKLLKALQKKSEKPSGGSSEKITESKKQNFAISIFDLNKFLLLAIIVCIAILIYQIRSGAVLLRQEFNVSQVKEVSSQDLSGNSKNKADVSYYLETFSKRNIFKPYDISLGKAAVGQPNLAKRLSKYKLVGVSWLDLPESASVMIEDAQSKTTYILKTGEKLEDVTIKTIYTDRVVLSYENEETTIKL